MFDVEFRPHDTGTWMVVSYDIGDFETGSEFFSYFDNKPENVIRETRKVETSHGLMQCAIQLRSGSGYGVAYPASN